MSQRAPLASSLTATWLNFRHYERRADSLRWLNAQTGAHYTNSRLNEWLRGDREPNREARLAMLRDCLPHLFPNIKNVQLMADGLA